MLLYVMQMSETGNNYYYAAYITYMSRQVTWAAKSYDLCMRLRPTYISNSRRPCIFRNKLQGRKTANHASSVMKQQKDWRKGVIA